MELKRGKKGCILKLGWLEGTHKHKAVGHSDKRAGGERGGNGRSVRS